MQRLMNQSLAGMILEQMLAAGPGCECDCGDDDDAEGN
jgi:hypothetical protein